MKLIKTIHLTRKTLRQKSNKRKGVKRQTWNNIGYSNKSKMNRKP